MTFDKFPLAGDYPLTTTREAVQRVWDTAHQTARSNRGGAYNEAHVIRHNMEELYFLYDLARGEYDTLDGYIFQGGVFCGGSACAMALGLKDAHNTNKPLVAVDVFKAAGANVFPEDKAHWAFVEARQNMIALGLEEQMCLSMCNDVAVAPLFRPQFRIIMIDSSHSYRHTLAELDAMIPLVTRNGFMVLHDYYETHCGVKQAVDEYFAGFDARRFWIYDFERPVHDTSNRFIVVKFEDGL